MRPSVTRLSAILLLLTAALCSHQASTRRWGDAVGPEGARLRLAPNGISRVAADGSLLASCRWFPLHGNDPLCQAASGGESRFQRLTYAYPALQTGAWLSFLAMIVLTLAGPQASGLTRTLAALAAAATTLGILLVVSSAPAAAALAGLRFGLGGPGLFLAVAAPAADLAGGLLISTAASPARDTSPAAA